MRVTMERSAYWMFVAIAALIFVFGWGRIDVAPAQAITAPTVLGGNGLITHFHEDSNGQPTRVIVIDPQQKRMAVYHVAVGNGAIQLKSVRNLTVDLQIQDYNSNDPSPIDMQKMLQRN